MMAAAVLQVPLKYIQKSPLKPVVQKCRKVMHLQKERFRDCSEEKKSAALSKSVMTLVLAVFLLQSVSLQQD